MKKLIGTYSSRTAAEFAKHNYIHKYFIPDVTKVPIIKRVGSKYHLKRH